MEKQNPFPPAHFYFHESKHTIRNENKTPIVRELEEHSMWETKVEF